MKIKLVKSTEYFFLLKKVTTDVKLNKELIKINFKDELNYNNVFFIKKNDYLYIYNTNYDKKFFIPEGFILFASLDKDGIYIFRNPDGYYNVIIKQDNILKNDFTIKNVTEFIKTSLSYEYSLPILEEDYTKAVEKGLKRISYFDLLKLMNLLTFDKQKIKNYIFELSLPFLAAIILVYVSLIGVKIVYENKNQDLENKYRLIKNKFIKLDEKIKLINSLNDNVSFINNYINPKVLEIANNIAKMVNETDFRLSYLKIDYLNRYILFTVDGNNSTLVLEKLSKLKSIANLRLSSEVPLYETIKRYRFEGQIHD